MSPLLQTLLDLIGNPDREDLNSIRAPLEARLQQIDPSQRRQLFDEVKETLHGLSRDDSQRYYSHFLLFQYLARATHRRVEPNAEQQAILNEVQRDIAAGKSKNGAAPVTFTPEEVIARHPWEKLIDPSSATPSPASK